MCLDVLRRKAGSACDMTVWSTGKGSLNQVKIQGERGDRRHLEREGATCLFSTQWVTAVSNLPYAYLSYMSVMCWVFEGVYGSLVPNSHQALRQCGCSAVTK